MPATVQEGHDIIVLGASAGGIDAITRLVQLLPPDLPASLFVVLHLHPRSPNALVDIVQGATGIRVVPPVDPTPVERGCIYIAPPDRHMLLVDGQVRVVNGPKENRHRPAIDPLFRSAAWSYGPRVVGVVLSGTLGDGTGGLWAIKSCGGVTAVQEPSDARHAEMPANALAALDVDHTLPINELAPLLVRLVHEPAPPTPARPESERYAAETAAVETGLPIETMNRIGALSPFTCPGCGGALWQLEERGGLRYRCHVGHAYSADAMMNGKSDVLEHALYSALQLMEEKAELTRRLDQTYAGKWPEVSARYQDRAEQLEQDAAILRHLLISGRGR